MDSTTCSIFLITWKSVSLKQNPPYSSNKTETISWNWNTLKATHYHAEYMQL